MQTNLCILSPNKPQSMTMHGALQIVRRKSVMTSRYPISITLLSNSKMHASVLLWHFVLASWYSIQSPGLLKALWHSSLADLFNRTPNHLIWEVLSHIEINVQRLFVHKYPPLSATRCSWSLMNENTDWMIMAKVYPKAQDLNPGSFGWVLGVL